MSDKKANEYAIELCDKSDMPLPFSSFIFFKNNRESLLPLKNFLRPVQQKMYIEENPDLSEYAKKANSLLSPAVMKFIIE